MFNNIKKETEKTQMEINSMIADIKKLKESVGSEEKETQSLNDEFINWFSFLHHKTLFERVGDLEDDLQEMSNKFNVLLEHFNIEYVEITEKNGGTHTTQKYRPIKNKKK